MQACARTRRARTHSASAPRRPVCAGIRRAPRLALRAPRLAPAPSPRSALPNIVANNGGKGIYFLFNYVRCQYTDERDIAPVDLVSEAHPCMDQRAWCNRRLPSVDIRLEAFDVGRLQIADELGEWAHVTVDESELSTTADVVCRTLGFLRVRDARLDSRTRVHRRLACGEVAAASGKISVRRRARGARARMPLGQTKKHRLAIAHATRERRPHPPRLRTAR